MLHDLNSQGFSLAGDSPAQHSSLAFGGCGSKIGTPNGTLVRGNMDQNLRSPGGLTLTHTLVLPRGTLHITDTPVLRASASAASACFGWEKAF